MRHATSSEHVRDDVSESDEVFRRRAGCFDFLCSVMVDVLDSVFHNLVFGICKPMLCPSNDFLVYRQLVPSVETCCII